MERCGHHSCESYIGERPPILPHHLLSQFDGSDRRLSRNRPGHHRIRPDLGVNNKTCVAGSREITALVYDNDSVPISPSHQSLMAW